MSTAVSPTTSEVVAIRPGDGAAAATGTGWLREYAEDLIQTARTGLIAAVDRYDPAKNQSFVPYAVASVVGELKRHLRDTSWRLHVARPRKDHVLRLCRAADLLSQQLGRPPTVAELGDQLDLSEEAVLEGLEAAQSRLGISLDRPVAGTPDRSLGELLADPGPREEPEALTMPIPSRR